MDSLWEITTPERSKMLGRIIGLLLFSSYWMLSTADQAGLILLLCLTVTSLARWRFSLPSWTLLIDQGVCLLATFFWPSAWYGFAFPVFEALLLGKIIWLLPFLILLVTYTPFTVPLLAVLGLAGFIGWVIRCWSLQVQHIRKEGDRERRERYELEGFKDELLSANIQAARIAEIAERQRISQKLHDHAGHEITAAALALQAFEQLWKENDPKAKEMFIQAKQRVSNSAIQLRETVHNLNPVKAFGIHRFDDICRSFKACPIELHTYGDTFQIEAYQWNILESCLKEALTNVIRHTNASLVNVTLDVNPHIVRLSVHDDGTVHKKHTDGLGTGLRNLRQRAKFAGGSLSTDQTKGFLLICVLPLRKENQA